MLLSRLIRGIALTDQIGRDVEITSLTCDSRTVSPGGLFAAFRGEKTDGTQFIQEALDRGAAAVADLVILTSDNPRTEDPEAILDQVAAGFPPGFTAWVRQPDRRAAIRQALSMGRAGDVILLAGKGHETEQEIGTQRVHLDEREEIASFFQQNTL